LSLLFLLRAVRIYSLFSKRKTYRKTKKAFNLANSKLLSYMEQMLPTCRAADFFAYTNM